MAEVIGVRFKEVGKVYYFDPDGQQLKKGDRVIVETVRGIECGEVAMDNREIDDEQIVKPLKKLIRIADEKDIAQFKANKAKEKDAFAICQQKIANHNLEMKLVDVEYTFDCLPLSGNKTFSNSFFSLNLLSTHLQANIISLTKTEAKRF